ncbi:matrix-remodeling-associated protein 5 [Genypterus blacodes]|uniref:matrix-remodeling-associated protein 5 n=1 Tax=Genypterus blacodes TaxID=154954 RepID=UPI003F768359
MVCYFSTFTLVEDTLDFFVGTSWSLFTTALSPDACGMDYVPSQATRGGIAVMPHLDFLTGRPQVVRMGNLTSFELTLSTGAPQGCVLSPLLYAHTFTHDVVATRSTNVIIKFADDTTILGLIPNNDETAYRKEVSALPTWCQENNLSLNISRTKEMIVDCRKRQKGNTPIHINAAEVERVSHFKFLVDLDMEAPAVCFLHTLLALLVLPQATCLPCPRLCACPQPTELHCTFRSLVTIPASVSRQVQRMNLGFNSINKITDKSLAGLRRLEHLMIHGNDIHSVSHGAFRDLISVQMLKLSYNKLKEISRHTLHGLWALARLHLDHNQLEFIQPDTFQGLTSLRLLQLEGNRLQQLHPSTFTSFTLMGHFHISALRHLYLSDNMLTSLSSKLVDSMPQLENLYLHGNPWTCDCTLKWLWDWDQASPGILKCKKDRSLPGGQLCPICSSPKHLQRKEIRAAEVLVCNSPVISSFPQRGEPSEDNDSELMTAKDFEEPFGNISLGLSDKQGNEVDLDCSIREPRKPHRMEWKQVDQLQLASTIVFSVNLECPVDRNDYERLWRLIAYYSSVPAHLQREMSISKDPHPTYTYRQDTEKDALYYTGVKINITAQPTWLMQTSVDLQLNRAQSTAKVVKLILSTNLSQTVEAELVRRQQRTWVMIQSTNATQKFLSAVVGGATTMHCDVESSGQTVTQWMLPDSSRVDAPNSSPDKRVSVSSDGQLDIKSVRHTDTGLYYCISRVHGDLSVLAFRLTVEGSSSPSQGDDAPFSPLEGFAGDTMLLPCTASGSPDAEISWILPDSNIVSFRTNSNPKMLAYANGSLQITEGQLSDAGYYKCIAMNQHGVDTQATQISITRRKEPIMPLRKFPTRHQSASGVNTRIKVPSDDTVEASGLMEVPQEDPPVSRPDVLKRRGPGLMGTGRRGGHPPRNIGWRLTMQRRPTGSRAEDRKHVVESRRRKNMTQNKIDPEKWANILAKIGERNNQNTVKANPEQTTQSQATRREFEEHSQLTVRRPKSRRKNGGGRRRQNRRRQKLNKSGQFIAITTVDAPLATSKPTGSMEINMDSKKLLTTKSNVYTDVTFTTSQTASSGGPSHNENVSLHPLPFFESTPAPPSSLVTYPKAGQGTSTSQTTPGILESASSPSRLDIYVSANQLPVTTEEETQRDNITGARQTINQKSTHVPTSRTAIMPRKPHPPAGGAVQRDKPSIMKSNSQTITVTAETDAQLPCEAADEPELLSWTQVTTGTRIAQNTDIHRFQIHPNGTLIIRDTLPGDQGQYLCTVQNLYGTDKTVINLVVVSEHPRVLQLRHRNTTVHLGGNAALECKVEGSPLPRVTWLLPNHVHMTAFTLNVTAQQRVTALSDGTLLITQASHTDAGIYKCTASSAAGTDTVSVRLHVSALAPVIQQAEHESISLLEGSTVFIHCTATGAPLPVILWITPEGHHVVTSQDSRHNPIVFPNGTLYMHGLGIRNAGRYECVASNAVAVSRRQVILSVQRNPSSLLAKASIMSSSPQETDVLYGGKVLLNCLAKGEPEPRIIWRTPSKKLVDAHYSFDHRIKVFLNGTISIHSVTDKDRGDYLCMARNKMGDDYVLLRVSVLTRPAKIEQKHRRSSQEVVYGADLKVDCVTSGLPDPQITWVLPDGTMVNQVRWTDIVIGGLSQRYVVFDNGTLYFHNVDMREDGDYTCYAENHLGKDEMKVRVKVKVLPPQIQDKDQKTVEVLVTPPKINGLEGAANTIQVVAVQDQRKLIDCMAKGKPTPQTLWVLPENMVLPAPYYSNRMTVHQNGTLDIRSPKRSDSGQLACIARNEGGEVRLTVKLDVKEETAQMKSGRLPLTVGNSMILPCSFDSVNTVLPHITWLLPNGTPLQSGDRLSKFFHRPDGFLVISNPSVAEAGLYRCLGRHSGGLVEQTVTLSQGRKPEINTRYSSPVSVMNGEVLLLHCVTQGEPLRLTWTFPSGVVLNRPQRAGRYAVLPNGTLAIQQTSVYDQGSYVCRAANEYGSSLLSVLVVVVAYPPRITNSPPSVTYAKRGVAVQLNCVVTGIPRAEVAWETPDKTRLVVSTQPRLYGNKYLHPHGALIIQKPTQRDAGMYRCTARNAVGVDSKTTYLNVF